MESLNGHIFPFFKGRVALYAILKALRIKPKDDVILPGFTCVVVPNAIKYLDANPVYIDIDPETYNIDPEKIEEKITRKTKVIIAQHTFGIPAKMDKILEIAEKYGLYVIEDSCHSISSKYKGKEVGTFGDAAFYSSQWSKPLTTGLGGWAVVNNPLLKINMEKIYPEFVEPSFREGVFLMLQYTAYSKLFKPSLFWSAQNTYRRLSGSGIAVGSSTHEELECRMPDKYEKKMSQWQYNLLEREFMNIDKINSHRIWVASLYEDFLKEKGIKTVELSEEYDPVFLRYPVLVENKNNILNKAKEKRIEIGDWFVSPVHPNLDRWEKAGYEKGMCLNAERICDHVINLPTHQRVSKDDVINIVDLCANF